MTEAEFDRFIEEAYDFGKKKNTKYLRMNPALAKRIHDGEIIETEHFRWIEKEPGVFALVEKENL